MELLVLTKMDMFIIGPISELLGWIMNGIYMFFEGFGIYNIGLCIIVFTILVNLLLFPLRIKQQKSSKLQAVINPEMQAITAKYKGKRDDKSMRDQQAELQALYDKYGYSQFGGCLPLLIEMPIIVALYQVIYRIPAYVSSVKDVFMSVVNEAVAYGDFASKIGDLANANGMNPANYDFSGASEASVNYIIDLFYKFDRADWNTFYTTFDGIQDKVSGFVNNILDMNNFFGISLVENPQILSVAVLIPILSGVFQYLCTKIMTTGTQIQAAGSNQADATAGMMKGMNATMPIFSVVMCFFLPCGVGLYWAASSMIRFLQQWITNQYMKKVSLEDIVKQNIEKKNKKRAKKGLPPIRQNAAVNLKNIDAHKKQEQVHPTSGQQKDQTVKETPKTASKPSPGGIAAKAGMVKDFNEKNNKKK